MQTINPDLGRGFFMIFLKQKTILAVLFFVD